MTTHYSLGQKPIKLQRWATSAALKLNEARGITWPVKEAA